MQRYEDWKIVCQETFHKKKLHETICVLFKESLTSHISQIVLLSQYLLHLQKKANTKEYLHPSGLDYNRFVFR
jgi:invasion protein IalB